MVKSAKGAAETITSNWCAEVVMVMKNMNVILATQGQGKAIRQKDFHEINEEKNESMDDLAYQVQSLFYHDMHFNAQ